MKRIKIFGAGGGGRNVVLYMQQNGIVDADYCMVCSGFCPSEHSVMEHICLFGEQHYISDFSCEKGCRFVYNLNTDKNFQKVEMALAEVPELLVIIVGLSGRSGTCITEMISEVARRINIRTIIVATLPYKFEGDKRMVKAHQQLDSLNKLDVPIHVIPAESVFEKYPNTDLYSSFPNLDKVVSDYIKSVLIYRIIPYMSIEFGTL